MLHVRHQHTFDKANIVLQLGREHKAVEMLRMGRDIVMAGSFRERGSFGYAWNESEWEGGQGRDSPSLGERSERTSSEILPRGSERSEGAAKFRRAGDANMSLWIRSEVTQSKNAGTLRFQRFRSTGVRSAL